MKALTRVFRKDKDPNAQLNYFYDTRALQTQTRASIIDDDADELKSVSSFSTTATCDDNVGTGRVLDKYFYQPAGRRVERFLRSEEHTSELHHSGESRMPSSA